MPSTPRTTYVARIPLDELFEGVDIELPRRPRADPDRNPVPDMEPFTIYEDDRGRVKATLVEHLPVFPSFGFRFETEYGVIAFSGDTAETPNMVRLSRDADLLVHEVVNMDYYRDQDFTEEFLHHLETSHTTPEGIGRIAAEDRVKKVVVSHMAGVFSDADLAGIADTYDGPYTLAADRQLFSVRRDRTEAAVRSDPAYCATYPPSTDHTAPVTKLVASEARKQMTSATSSGVPRRPMGWRAVICERTESSKPAVNGVST